MTVVEMHELADLLIDKANGPWFTSAEKDKFLNLAQSEYVDKNYRMVEKDEEVRAKLNSIVRTTNLGSVAQINLSGIADFRYVLKVKGTFVNNCGRDVVRKIPPIQWDDEAENQVDPFNVNDNENPGYTQENIVGTGNVLDIIPSTPTPTNVILTYLKTPVNVFNNPGGANVDSELPPSTHEEIVNLAVRKMLGTVESQVQYQVQANEIVDQNFNNK